MISLSDLITPKTKEEMYAILLERLRGFSAVDHSGTATGRVTITDTSVAPPNPQVVVIEVRPTDATQFNLWIAGVQETIGESIVKNTDIDLGALDGRLAGVVIQFSGDFTAGESYGFATNSPTFPTTAWQVGSVPRTILEAEADALAEVTRQLAEVANGGFLELATDDWLTMLAFSSYGLTRYPATPTVGHITLTNPSGGGAHTIAVGQLWFRSNTGLLYTNSTGGTLAAGPSTLSLSIKAELPGQLYNTPAAGEIVTMVTPLPGVTCSNPSGWIDTQGTDEESDTLLRQRCRDQWSTLGTGSTEAVYRYWARSASSSVTRVQVIPNPLVPGNVRVILAGPAGGVSAGVVSVVQAYLEERIPLTTTVTAEAAWDVTCSIAGVCYVTGGPSGQAAAEADVAAKLADLFAGIDIGGTVYESEVMATIQSAANVRNVGLSLPVADAVGSDGNVWVFDTTSLLFVQV